MKARATYVTQSGIRLLHDWGAALQRAFPGHTAYLVGSALTRADHRDVDVRVILADDAYTDLSMMVTPADLNLAVSLWGQQVTGLPIDFQVQSDTDADQYNGRRHPLGLADAAAYRPVPIEVAPDGTWSPEIEGDGTGQALTPSEAQETTTP